MGVVVPFLNEERVLGEMLGSIAAQERPPDHLVLVDDGSTDGSIEMAMDFATRHTYVTVVRRSAQPAGPDRLTSASELIAFQSAVDEHGEHWDVVAKLDADLRLPPCALGELERRLQEDELLGIAGTFLSEEMRDGTIGRLHIGEGHVHGATKFYRRQCWDQIAPLPPILGWDTIDELRARMHGWVTQSFAISGGDPLHLRPRGTHDGLLRGYRRWGECAWAFGESSPFMALQAARYMGRPPMVRGGLNYALGWASAALGGNRRAEPELLAYARHERRLRLRRRVLASRRWRCRRK